MEWKDKCILALSDYYCFVSMIHKNRFITLFRKYQDVPFFNRQVAKVLVLISWNQDKMNRFEKMVEEMMEKSKDRGDRDLSYMLERLKNRRPLEGANDRVLLDMAIEFLEKPGQTPDESCLMKLSRVWLPVGDCALHASEIIDRL